jgi:hypothetical protein
MDGRDPAPSADGRLCRPQQERGGRLHATKAGALAAAVRVLNIILADEDLPTLDLAMSPTEEDIDSWLDKIGEKRGEEKDDREFDVWIEEKDLLGDEAAS